MCLWLKNQNVEQKQYCNKFNKAFFWTKNGTCGPQNNVGLISEHRHPEGPHYMTERKEGEQKEPESLLQEVVV